MSLHGRGGHKMNVFHQFFMNFFTNAYVPMLFSETEKPCEGRIMVIKMMIRVRDVGDGNRTV